MQTTEGAEIKNTSEITNANAPASEQVHEGKIHIALSAERLGNFLDIPITNTLITSLLVSVILAGIAIFVGRKISMVPGKFQTAVEFVFEYIFNFVKDTLGSAEYARKFFPLITTTFLFIWIANAIEFFPGIGSLIFSGQNGDVPFLRSANTDLNVTLALTIVAVLIIEFSGIVALGFFKYFGKFFTIKSPIAFIVGLIEFVSELARVVSFSFRLFGNIFAGEVIIAVATFFAPYIIPVPFMLFEFFVGFVQAAIFTLLMLFFIKMAITDPHEAH